MCLLFFFFNDTATTEIYTLSLHDALPISDCLLAHSPLRRCRQLAQALQALRPGLASAMDSRLLEMDFGEWERSEEHTSELQSPCNLVCRLLLEKKKLHTDGLLDSNLVHLP